MTATKILGTSLTSFGKPLQDTCLKTFEFTKNSLASLDSSFISHVIGRRFFQTNPFAQFQYSNPFAQFQLSSIFAVTPTGQMFPGTKSLMLSWTAGGIVHYMFGLYIALVVLTVIEWLYKSKYKYERHYNANGSILSKTVSLPCGILLVLLDIWLKICEKTIGVIAWVTAPIIEKTIGMDRVYGWTRGAYVYYERNFENFERLKFNFKRNLMQKCSLLFGIITTPFPDACIALMNGERMFSSYTWRILGRMERIEVYMKKKKQSIIAAAKSFISIVYWSVPILSALFICKLSNSIFSSLGFRCDGKETLIPGIVIDYWSIYSFSLNILGWAIILFGYISASDAWTAGFCNICEVIMRRPTSMITSPPTPCVAFGVDAIRILSASFLFLGRVFISCYPGKFYNRFVRSPGIFAKIKLVFLSKMNYIVSFLLYFALQRCFKQAINNHHANEQHVPEQSELHWSMSFAVSVVIAQIGLYTLWCTVKHILSGFHFLFQLLTNRDSVDTVWAVPINGLSRRSSDISIKQRQFLTITILRAMLGLCFATIGMSLIYTNLFVNGISLLVRALKFQPYASYPGLETAISGYIGSFLANVLLGKYSIFTAICALLTLLVYVFIAMFLLHKVQNASRLWTNGPIFCQNSCSEQVLKVTQASYDAFMEAKLPDKIFTTQKDECLICLDYLVEISDNTPTPVMDNVTNETDMDNVKDTSLLSIDATNVDAKQVETEVDDDSDSDSDDDLEIDISTKIIMLKQSGVDVLACGHCLHSACTHQYKQNVANSRQKCPCCQRKLVVAEVR